eukprot:13916241-Heterocapsa_arctica.AAC.1
MPSEEEGGRWSGRIRAWRPRPERRCTRDPSARNVPATCARPFPPEGPVGVPARRSPPKHFLAGNDRRPPGRSCVE